MNKISYKEYFIGFLCYTYNGIKETADDVFRQTFSMLPKDIAKDMKKYCPITGKFLEPDSKHFRKAMTSFKKKTKGVVDPVCIGEVLAFSYISSPSEGIMSTVLLKELMDYVNEKKTPDKRLYWNFDPCPEEENEKLLSSCLEGLCDQLAESLWLKGTNPGLDKPSALSVMVAGAAHRIFNDLQAESDFFSILAATFENMDYGKMADLPWEKVPAPYARQMAEKNREERIEFLDKWVRHSFGQLLLLILSAGSDPLEESDGK